MRVLVTNDDGIHARGIATLESVAREVFARVVTVAPDREMSGVSQSLSLHAPLRLVNHGEDRYSVSGTPVDSVFVGLGHVMATARPDLVLSGINHGPNVGNDIYYSGTVGAAREALIHGIGAMALSFTGHEPLPFDVIRPVVARLLTWVRDHGVPDGVLLNVNIPNPRENAAAAGTSFCGVSGLAGIQVTRLGKRTYGNEVVTRDDPRGREYLWIGGAFPRMERIEGTDCEAVRRGYVSVTPIELDVTSSAGLEALATLPTDLNHD